MKLTNLIVKKFGSDKLLHFLIAGWGAQIGTLINIPCGIIIALIIILLNWVKEKYWDSAFDIKDLVAAILGATLAIILACLL